MLYFILEFIGLLLVLSIAAVLLHFFAKRWNDSSFKKTFKFLVVYILGVSVIRLFYPSSISFTYHPSSISFVFEGIAGLIMSMLVFVVINFFIFYFIAKQFMPLNWKRALVSFLVISILVFPFLSYGKTIFIEKVTEIPLFEKQMGHRNPRAFTYDVFSEPFLLFFTRPVLGTLHWINNSFVWVPNYWRSITYLQLHKAYEK